MSRAILVALLFFTPNAVVAQLVCGAEVGGSITLTEDLFCSGTALFLENAGPDPIVVDLGGYTIGMLDCVGSCATIDSYGPVVLQNGQVVRAVPPNSQFTGFTILNWHGLGVLQDLVVDGGVVGAGASTVVRRSTFVDGASISVNQAGVTVEDSDFVDGPVEGRAILGARSSFSIQNNTFSGYGLAIDLWDLYANPVIADNIISDGGISIAGYGRLDSGSVTRNYVASALGDGISVTWAYDDSNINVDHNTVLGSGGDGIYATNGATLTGNVAIANQNLGIDAVGAIDGGGNRATGNGDPLECVGVVCMSAWPVIDVSPTQYDFGSVGLGTSSSQIVTISNTGDSVLVVGALALVAGRGAGFGLTNAPPVPFEVEPNASVDIDLIFTPTQAGGASATLMIESDDPDDPFIGVPLSGAGVSYDDQAMELLAFFDAAVANGDLIGNGPGPLVASLRLQALRNMIEASGDLLDQGRTRIACRQLEVARRRTNGLFPPPDFVSGPAAPDLEAETAHLRTNLGCDAPKAGGGCGLGAELAFVVPLLALVATRRQRAS